MTFGIFWSPPGPLDPNLKTGTLLRSIREKLSRLQQQTQALEIPGVV